MENKKVLHLFPEFKRGGAQINVLRFINASRSDFEHHVAALPQDETLEAEYTASGTEIHPIDMTSVKPGSIYALVKLIRELKPDIVHVNGKGAAFYGFISSFFTTFKKTEQKGKAAHRSRSYKMFHTMRGFHIKYTGFKLKLYLAFERAVAGRMDGTVLVSPSEKDLLNDKIPGLDQSRLFLIPNGINVRDIQVPVEMETVLNKYSKNIVTLSRLSHQKDLITMVESFDLFAGDLKGAALHILGGETPQDRAYAGSVKARIENSPFRERIFLWGSVKDAGSLIRYFDLYWSTALFEGLPTAVVEAALCRVPIVGTDCVGNKDLIIPGKTGILTVPGDAAGNAAGIRDAFTLIETGQIANFVEEAEKMCLDFSPENNVIRIKEMYRSSYKD